MAKKNEASQVVNCCARCNGKKSSEWITVQGVTVGIECADDLNELIARGLKGEALTSALREDYKVFMRETTVTGQILKGQLKLNGKDGMISKGKITADRFLEIATKRYRGDFAKQVISDPSM